MVGGVGAGYATSFTSATFTPNATRNASPSLYIDDLIRTPFRPDADGFLTLPDAPCLGVELNPEALRRYGGG